MIKYRVVGFIRVEPEEEDENAELDTIEEALSELNHCRNLQPENMYIIEQSDSSLRGWTEMVIPPPG